MARKISPSTQCLSCGMPFSGWTGQIGRWIGVGRSLDNPNLCNRCRGHLIEGLLSSCSVLEIKLGPSMQFGRVPIEGSTLELGALLTRMRAQVEAAGGFVLPAPVVTSGFRAFFNVPIPLNPGEHAGRALDVARGLLREAVDEGNSMGLAIPAKLAVVSGFAEVLEAQAGGSPVPYSQRAELLPDLLAQAESQQIAVDDETLVQLDHGSIIPQRGSLTVLDATGARSLRSLQMVRPAASQPLTPLLALLAALLAVPCVAMVVVSPVAITVGLGALLGATLPFYKAVGMSFWPRILLTGFAVVLASANLIVTEGRLHQLRRLQQQAGVAIRLSRWQRFRLRSLRLMSALVLALVFLEGVLRVTVMHMPLF